MRVAFDAHMVGERETGNETYALNLVRALLALPPEARSGIELILYATHPERLLPRLDPAELAPIRRIRPEPAPLRVPFSLPLAALQDQADLLHVCYVAPPVRPCPCVVTVHDISYEFYPQFFSPRDRLMLRTMVPLTLRRAAWVITVSEHSRREIMRRYSLPADRIAVTYEAAASQYRPIADPAVLADVRARYGLRERYLLALGNLQPRKNLIRLVDAFVRLAEQGRLEGTQLVLGGKAQWRESDLFARVKQSGLAEQICFPGYVADADLPALYSGALAFVYPSLYEGFGLPPLEAMACATPVVCSNAASLPEVVGDAALTCDPRDTESLAVALAQVIAQPALREELAARGLRRAAQFSWRRCAEETLAVYRAAVAKDHHRRPA
ncbi:MAG: glycosyltransferase family 1 protein [Chloroflexi bacterium HGW-Chloroflexi-1]|nr:MAG: glycosyltransferase family 1 protein [Chloroflexi bacterium HGW-Chloroflexi-1]